MINATYNIPASQWTAAIDAALGLWAASFHGSANLNINVTFQNTGDFLAMAGPDRLAYAGKFGADEIVIPVASYKIASNFADSGNDINLIINPNKPWHFGSIETTPMNAYSAISVMAHELGHGLFMMDYDGPGISTPYGIYAANDPLIDGNHSLSSADLMYHMLFMGQQKSLSENDIELARKSGLSTGGDDYIFVPVIAESMDAGAGHDVAIWLGDYSSFSVELVNFELLSMPNADLSLHETDLFKLYQAAFQRAPDLAGFDWWSDFSIGDVASAFVGSSEFSSAYDTTSRGSFISDLYQNVLGRAAEMPEFEYWAGRCDLSDAELLLSFALSSENQISNVEFLV